METPNPAVDSKSVPSDAPVQPTPTWITKVGVQHVTSVLKVPYACNCPVSKYGQCAVEFKAEFWRPRMQKDTKEFLRNTVEVDAEYHKYTQIWMPLSESLQLWWFGSQEAFGFVRPGDGIILCGTPKGAKAPATVDEAMRRSDVVKYGDPGDSHTMPPEYSPTIVKWLTELRDLPCEGIAGVEKAMLSAVGIL